MLTPKLKKLVSDYPSLNLEFKFIGSQWDILVKNNGTKAITNDLSKLYILLIELMPGIAITDFYDDVIGQNNFEISTYHSEGDKIIIYKGSLFENGFRINEVEFDKVIDLYIYAFTNLPNISLGSSSIKKLGLQNPLEIMTENIQTIGFRLTGLQCGGVDDEGYSYNALVIEKEGTSPLVIQYPQKDSLNYRWEGIRNVEELITPLTYNGEFLEILNCIKKGEIDTYFEKYSWA